MTGTLAESGVGGTTGQPPERPKEALVTVVDGALDAMSGLTSQPNLGSIVEALRHGPRDSGVSAEGGVAVLHGVRADLGEGGAYRGALARSGDRRLARRQVAGGRTAVAKDVGDAIVTATSEGQAGTSAVTVTNPVEARALWVTRFEYTTASAVDFAKIATIFQKAASANFNVVYFQVRTSGDALYFSDIEPCSPRMCGFLGGPRPAQDPLAVALTEAAKYGIEVHAWLNAYTGFIAGSR